MKDGRVVTTDGTRPSDGFVRDVRDAVERRSGIVHARAWRARARGWPASDAAGRRRCRRGRGSRRCAAPGPQAPSSSTASLSGVVIALPRSALRQLGPTLAVVGAVLVVLGTTVAALLIFGPVRPRLRSLEDAARKVGSGDLTARAREDGGDEVAALARAFNQMTHDLQQRADQLQAADRTRRLLLADVSHELMTPLTGMRGYLETLSLHAQSLESRNTRALSRHHSRRNAARRAHRRRPAGSVAPRRRRRVVRCAGRAARGSVRAGGRAPRPRRRTERRRACDEHRAGRRDRHGRSHAARAGAPESGRERAAPHAEGRPGHAERGLSKTARSS